MQSIKNKIINRIYGKGRGWCYTPKSFSDLGSPEAIRITLHRLEKKGAIRRLSRGIYEYPKKHPTIGFLSPNPDKIAEAISVRDAIRIRPSGAFAANILGLSNQVPAKIVFLTDGSGRRIKIGPREIIFKRTTPRNMAGAKSSGTLILALKYIGKEQVSQDHIKHFRESLSNHIKMKLKKDSIYAPGWICPIIDEIVKDTNA
jgi:hypothetical protein